MTLHEKNGTLPDQAVGPATLPDAFDRKEQITNKIRAGRLLVFLDFDGTLAEIVPHPDDARLADGMQEALEQLAELCPVVIVSGRDRQDVEKRVVLPEMIYAGSHGFDIKGPQFELEYEGGVKSLPDLEQSEKELNEKLRNVQGAQVERKKFAIAVHYRNVREEDAPAVEQAVDEALKGKTTLKRSGGKKVWELKPAIDWNKGKAVKWISDKLSEDGNSSVPLYIGDDVTDEDAFREIKGEGIGILAGEHGGPTWADYRVENVGSVKDFLYFLADILSGKK